MQEDTKKALNGGESLWTAHITPILTVVLAQEQEVGAQP